MRAVRVLLRRVLDETRAMGWAAATALSSALTILAMMTAESPGEARRAWCAWIFPLLTLAVVARQPFAFHERARKAELDLERSRWFAPAREAALGVLGAAIPPTLLVGLLLLVGSLPFWEQGLSSGRWEQCTQLFPHAPPLLLTTRGASLPERHFDPEDVIEIPFRWRPHPSAPPEEEILLRLAIAHAGGTTAQVVPLPSRSGTIHLEPDIAGRGAIELARVRGAGWIHIESDGILRHHGPMTKAHAALQIWSRAGLYLLWLHLLVRALAVHLRPVLVAGLSACLLLPVFLDPVAWLGWQAGGTELWIWRTLVPDWTRGLSLDLWTQGTPPPLAALSWRGLLGSSLLLSAACAFGERRRRFP